MTDWEIKDTQHRAGVAAFKNTGSTPVPFQLICIEGNIGVGKTTLAQKLGEIAGAWVMLEPVKDNPYLEKYYSDPRRYALEMQFWLMSRRFEMHDQAIRYIWSTGGTVIMDRSIYGDWVFAKKNWLDGNIDDVGYQSYLHHRDVMNRQLLVPHTVLFLDSEPGLCQERVKARGRGCEKEIPLWYLEGIHDLHRELMLEMKGRGSKVVTLDWTEYHDPRAIAVGLGLV